MTARAQNSSADEHLLTGAQFFRQEQFDRALIEFRVAQKLGAQDAAWYAAASLVKLGRAEESVEAFAEAETLAPQARDAILDYYRALAHYEAKLFFSADAILASICQSNSPKISAQAYKLREAVAQVLHSDASAVPVAWYLSRSAAATAEKRRALAAGYTREAAEWNRRSSTAAARTGTVPLPPTATKE